MSRRDQSPEVSEPGGALSLIESGAAIVRAMNDQMGQVAVARPRDIKAVADESMEELEAFPQLASKAFYSIPYKDRRNNRIIYVEGPSIDAATSLVRCWGHSAITVRVEEQTQDACTMSGVFLDLQKNVRFEAPVRISRWEKNSETGKAFMLTEDRWALKVAAAASKAMRNAILKGLPKSLIVMYTERAKELAAGKGAGQGGKRGKFDPKTVIGLFAAYGIDEPTLLTLLNASSMSALTTEQKAQAKGLYNALTEGQVTAEALKARAGDDGGRMTVEADTTAQPEGDGEATFEVETD